MDSFEARSRSQQEGWGGGGGICAAGLNVIDHADLAYVLQA